MTNRVFWTETLRTRLTAYAWFVWERGYRGDPKIGWLFPEVK